MRGWRKCWVRRKRRWMLRRKEEKEKDREGEGRRSKKERGKEDVVFFEREEKGGSKRRREENRKSTSPSGKRGEKGSRGNSNYASLAAKAADVHLFLLFSLFSSPSLFPFFVTAPSRRASTPLTSKAKFPSTNSWAMEKLRLSFTTRLYSRNSGKRGNIVKLRFANAEMCQCARSKSVVECKRISWVSKMGSKISFDSSWKCVICSSWE